MYFQQQQNVDDEKKNDDGGKKSKLKPLKWSKPLRKGKIKLEIFVWGKARPSTMFRQPLNAHVPKHSLTPLLSDNLSKKKIWDVCAAREGYHCFGIGQNDWCFVWGETKQAGALGLGTNITATTPFLIRTLRKQRVKQACCSAIHSLCITDQMVIYGWGSKSLTLLDNDTKEPTPLNFLNGKGLKKLAAANTHSLAWNPNSIEIYSFGMPGPWLGYDDGDYGGGSTRFGVMKFDSSIAKNDDFSITFADCSSQYSLLILNTGYVGSCGVNEYGRMGVGKKIQSSAKIIWNRNLQNIVLCSAGSFHSGFVDTEGQVYTCGVGADFRLGHGDKETIWEPKLVKACNEFKICQIECVDARTFVIAIDGELILWGKEPINGRFHKLPFIHNHLINHRVYNICCGKDFNIAIAAERKEESKSNINIINYSVDSMQQDEAASNRDRLIGDVLGNHSLVAQKNFRVNTIYNGQFVGVMKSVNAGTSNNYVKQQQNYGQSSENGAPHVKLVLDRFVGIQQNIQNNGYQLMQQNSVPPINTVYGKPCQ